jgi:F0F1-type ATP synthase assembly protein I
MSAYATHILLILLLLLQVPIILLDIKLPWFMLLFTIIGLGQPILFVLAQRESYADWGRRLMHFPTLLLVAVGTAPSNSRAILQALFGNDHPFVRTPKGESGKRATIRKNQVYSYKLGWDGIWLIEMFLAIYAAVGLILAILSNNLGPIFLLVTCLMGFGYVAWLGLREVGPTRTAVRSFSPNKG